MTEERPTLTYSVIPSKRDGLPHAVWDFVLLSFRLDGGTLRAVCGDEVIPDNRLPPGIRLHRACRVALPVYAVPRPAPGEPMLKELARIISTDP